MILTAQILKDKGAWEDGILFFETNNLENKDIVFVFDYCIDKEEFDFASWLLEEFKDNKEFVTTERLVEFCNVLIGEEEFGRAKWLVKDFQDNEEFATIERLIEVDNWAMWGRADRYAS